MIIVDTVIIIFLFTRKNKKNKLISQSHTDPIVDQLAACTSLTILTAVVQTNFWL